MSEFSTEHVEPEMAQDDRVMKNVKELRISDGKVRIKDGAIIISDETGLDRIIIGRLEDAF